MLEHMPLILCLIYSVSIHQQSDRGIVQDIARYGSKPRQTLDHPMIERVTPDLLDDNGPRQFTV